MQSKNLPDDFSEVGLFALAQYEAKFPGKLKAWRYGTQFAIHDVRDELELTGCWSEEERRQCFRLEPTLDFFLASLEENNKEKRT